jgi:hypothetical protein
MAQKSVRFPFRVWAWKEVFDVKKAFGAISFVGACVFVACLPGDLRPEPARVYVSVEASDAAVNGFVTDDGWTIQFEKLLVGMGYTMLAGDDCEVYGEARYMVLFDFAVPGKQKLGEVYGLDACEIQFHVSMPEFYGYLGNGVTVADRDMILDRADIKANDYRTTSILARGNASRGSVTKHFAWRFREDYAFTECENAMGELVNTNLRLKGGDELRPLVTFHPNELFRDAIEADAKIRFDPLAAADTNADGEVSLEEVSQIPAPLVELTSDERRDAGVIDGGYLFDDMSTLPGWARFMAQRLWKRAFRLDGQVCRDNAGRSKRFEPRSTFDL